MRYALATLVFPALICSAALAQPTQPTTQSSEGDTQLRRINQRLVTENAQLKGQLADLEKRIAVLNQEIADLNTRLPKVSGSNLGEKLIGMSFEEAVAAVGGGNPQLLEATADTKVYKLYGKASKPVIYKNAAPYQPPLSNYIVTVSEGKIIAVRLQTETPRLAPAKSVR